MPFTISKDLFTQNYAPGKRSLPVTIVCVAYLLGMGYILWHLMKMPDEDSEMLSLILIPCLLGLSGLVYGLWKMKKWAASAFIGTSLLGVFRGIYPFEHFNIYILLFHFAVLVILFTQRKRMVGAA